MLSNEEEDFITVAKFSDLRKEFMVNQVSMTWTFRTKV